MRLLLSFCLTFVSLQSAAGQTAADLVLKNANIHTMCRQMPRAEAVAVAAGRIVSVGTNREIEQFVTSKTRVIDAGGRLVIPGFNDAHVHLAGIGNSFSHLDLREARSGREMLAKIAHFARVLPKGRWIMARGWDSSARGNLPKPADIDAVSPANPLLLYSTDYSLALINLAAAKLGGVAPPDGIVMGVDLDRVRRRVPVDHEKNWPEIIETASNYAASLGVTSVQDVHSDDLLAVLRGLDAAGKLKVRVYECIGLADRRKSIALGLKAASGNSMVRGGCVKGMSDGSDDEIAELRQQVAEADRAGLQVMIHAIGPAANLNMLSAFEAAIASNGSRDRRLRVEHFARARPADMLRLSRSGIIASMQPHLFFNGPAYGDDYRRIFAAGTMVAFGSDASITDFDPLLGVHAAANSGLRSISVGDAVRAYTLGSAFAEFQETEKGTIEAGKLADLVILSEDIFSIPVSRIRGVRVVSTIVGGRLVYDAGKALI